MNTKALKEALSEWSDQESSQMAIAQALGLMTEETNYQTGAKYVFWSNNPIGSMLHDFLKKLVELGIVEHRETESDDEYRWDPLFKGAWEKGTVRLSYREFWDVPRFFTIRLDCDVWLFDCRFDDSIDEYPEVYKVYTLPRKLVIDDNWNRIAEEGKFLGTVKVANIKFDQTRRQRLDLDFFSSFEPVH